VKKFVLLLALAALPVMAAEYKGVISDAKCAKAHTDGSEKAVKCITACVKGGQDAVLVTSDDKVVVIANKDQVMDHLGHKVVIDGKMEGDKLTVTTVRMDH
jgi:hypothetical protein